MATLSYYAEQLRGSCSSIDVGRVWPPNAKAEQNGIPFTLVGGVRQRLKRQIQSNEDGGVLLHEAQQAIPQLLPSLSSGNLSPDAHAIVLERYVAAVIIRDMMA